MNPAVFVVLGLGFVAVWYVTQPGGGGLGALFGGSSTGGGGALAPAQPTFTDAQLNYYLTGFATHLTSTQAAQVGASAGAPVAGVTFGISIAVGALAGWLSVRNSNDSREDREVFASRLGFRQLGGEVDPSKQKVTTREGRESLYGYLDYVSEQTGNDDGWELKRIGLNVIGRKDFDANVQWMVDVLGLLLNFGFAFPR